MLQKIKIKQNITAIVGVFSNSTIRRFQFYNKDGWKETTAF